MGWQCGLAVNCSEADRAVDRMADYNRSRCRKQNPEVQSASSGSPLVMQLIELKKVERQNCFSTPLRHYKV